MDLHQWLDAEDGRATWLASALKRSKAAVSLWRRQGVPLPLIAKVAELTDGAVTEDAMLRHALDCKRPKPPKRARRRRT